jgi:hypothetical protein
VQEVFLFLYERAEIFDEQKRWCPIQALFWLEWGSERRVLLAVLKRKDQESHRMTLKKVS